MDEEAGGYSITFLELSDQHQFTGSPETIVRDPFPIQDEDSKSNTSDDGCIGIVYL